MRKKTCFRHTLGMLFLAGIMLCSGCGSQESEDKSAEYASATSAQSDAGELTEDNELQPIDREENDKTTASEEKTTEQTTEATTEEKPSHPTVTTEATTESSHPIVTTEATTESKPNRPTVTTEATTESSRPTVTTEATTESKPNRPAVTTEVTTESKPNRPAVTTETTTEAAAPSAWYDSAAEEEVLRLLNQVREQNGCAPLVMDASLRNAARIRAEETSVMFAHQRPNGGDCFSILDELGIGYGMAGENIAAGQSSAESVMADWVSSPGHYANIIEEGFTKVGLACYRSSSGYGYYWVQIFIR